MKGYPEVDMARRTLMGPGPSNVDPRVLRVMATPLVGHLDPQFVEIMNETKKLLQLVFETKNELTIPISGTGSAGMEAGLCNLVEEGDEVLVAVNGYFGDRLCEIAKRCGAKLRRIDVPWGQVFEPEQIESALKEHRTDLLAIVHAETSTGALQPLEEIAAMAHQHGALVLVDAVTSLGGVRVEIDRWDVDACYSGTQKCLSCPPGLSPITFGPRATQKLRDRAQAVQSWYLDLSLIEKYWGQERSYHHTAPISMNYALYEALRLIQEEGLVERCARHELNSKALQEGLEAMGMKLFAPRAYRLPSLTSVRVPDGVDEARVRGKLLTEFNIEIGGGLGALKGKIWRMGLMGYSSRRENVMLALTALESALRAQGFSTSPGAGPEAAVEVFRQAEETSA